MWQQQFVPKVFFALFGFIALFSIYHIYSSESNQAVVIRRFNLMLHNVNYALNARLNLATKPPEVVSVTDNEEHVQTRYLVIQLHATRTTGGVGNAVFEVLAALGIAKLTNRIPAVKDTDLAMAERMGRMQKLLPNLFNDFVFLRVTKLAAMGLKGSFAMHGEITNMKNIEKDPKIFFGNAYLQSFKYFDTLSREEIHRRLEFPEGHKRLGQKLVPANFTNENLTRFCVHFRRGNFLASFPHLPSFANFTIAALKYMTKKVLEPLKKTISIIFLGNEPEWEREVYKNSTLKYPLFVVPYNEESPATIDWIFAELYCDYTLITASASTYGWWLGYLSKGQKVYYNQQAIQEQAKNELKHEDFFPETWIPLKLLNETYLIRGNASTARRKRKK